MTSPKRVDKRILLKVACWNVPTLQDSNKSECPQRKSALVALELTRLDVDIAALSEGRLAIQGSLTERRASYTLYWSERGPEEHKQSGVAFMVKQSLAKKLLDIPACHSDRLMSLILPLYGSRYVTIIIAYAPTLQTEPETKERFYADLRRVLCKVDTTDKLIIMGDFKFSTLEWGTTTALGQVS
ncbi:craniofacial development protein 2 [Biomphalaria glabrata]|nr:craniofacial development protein 2 [Biomphalaria glabrata]